MLAVYLWTAGARADSAPAAPASSTAALSPPVAVLAPAGPLIAAPPVVAVPSTSSIPRLELGQHFNIDPVSDGVLIAGGGGVSLLLSLILSTGEIAPPKPGPISNLLSIDRLAVTQTIDPNAGTYSSIMLGSAIGFAVLDPILSGFRDGLDAFEVDAVMYAETIALTQMLTDITKIAVRRPRPIDYINCSGTNSTAGACASTDLGLSFFSGHAATVASIGATATYLAFMRNPGTTAGKLRAWTTLVATVGLTGWVSYERVRSGQHFPTDVIAGSMAGAAIGVLVPHLHRPVEEAPVVVLGAAPRPGGGTLTLSGVF